MSKIDHEIRKLQKRVTNGGINRREFIKAATAMGMVTAREVVSMIRPPTILLKLPLLLTHPNSWEL